MKTLKLLTLALLPALGGAATLDAQTAMGVRAGMNRSTLTGAQETGALTGIAAGAYFAVGIGDRLALQIELGYGARGGDGVLMGENELDPDAGTASGIRLNYVETPVLLRAGYPGVRFLPSFFIGPYAMFLTSCELTPEGGSSGACNDQGRDTWFTPRHTDYGLVAGGALDYAIGESTIFVDIRFTLGLLSIHRGAGAMDLSNSGITLSGGFALPLGR